MMALSPLSTSVQRRVVLPHERVRVMDEHSMEQAGRAENASLKDFGDGSPLIITFVEQDGEQRVVLQTLVPSPHQDVDLLAPGEAAEFFLMPASTTGSTRTPR